MTYNLQYRFKPAEMSPGFEEGQQVCVHSGLTAYAKSLGVPCFALQLWRGEGETSYVEGYALVDMQTKQILFIDHRHDVCEYNIEQIAYKLSEQKESTETTQNSSITQEQEKDD